MMRRHSLLAAGLLAATFLSAPALAQHAGHDMASMPGMDHGQPAEPATAASDAPDAAPAVPDTPGNAPPPPVPTDHPADRFFPAERMAQARTALLKEGRMLTGAIQIDQLALLK